MDLPDTRLPRHCAREKQRPKKCNTSAHRGARRLGLTDFTPPQMLNNDTTQMAAWPFAHLWCTGLPGTRLHKARVAHPRPVLLSLVSDAHGPVLVMLR